jgi:hypothetical protein
MSVSYKCPNPECGATLKTANRVQVGKAVTCPKCKQKFVAESGDKKKEKEDEAAPLKLADEPKKPESAATKKPFADDDDEDAESVKKGYGVVTETEEEKEQAEKNKPKFTEVQDKFKKSARGPAMSLLVMPSNLLTIEGLVTCVAGLGAFVYGMWPLVFNDAPPGEEELDEAIVWMMTGVFVLFWGAMVCFCAAQMQELGSFAWAMTGAVMGVVPFLVGIYGIVMLQNPKVKAGFEEGQFVDEDGDEDDDDDDEDEDEEDEDEDEDDEKAKKKGKEKDGSGKKLAKKVGKGLLKKATGGDDDE